jgi:hypothetical protein
MKNLHLIPTDKPSRLMIDTIENKLYLQPILHEKTANVLTQNIYITSDEEIKEGDWLLIIDDFETYVHKHKGDNLPTTYCKKIILTNEQRLIDDGVQAIDDEFLEWFVKNPSCEEVETLKFADSVTNYVYKIIIPQEEPKQVICRDKFDRVIQDGCYVNVQKNGVHKVYRKEDGQLYFKPYGKEERVSSYFSNDFILTTIAPTNIADLMSKETLEEFIDKVDTPSDFDQFTFDEGIRVGAEWQAERMYSEEDMIAIVEKSRKTGLTAEYLLLTEQFKKK